MSNKIGLVFSGGGGKGSYEIGVWKAFRDLGIDKNISAVSGTSVGALNACLFLQGDYNIAEEVWLTISPEKIVTLNVTKAIEAMEKMDISEGVSFFLKKKVKSLEGFGIFTGDGLLKILDQHVDFSKVYNSPTKGYAACSSIANIITRKATYFSLKHNNEDRVKSILLASSALLGVFEPIIIDKTLYIDGCFCDNYPIKPLYEEGCNIIFVVHLKRDILINHNKFPNAKIIEITPQDNQGSIITGNLDFTSKGAARRLDQGYVDTMRMLEPIYKMGLIQGKLVDTLKSLKELERETSLKHELLTDKRNTLKIRLSDELDKL